MAALATPSTLNPPTHSAPPLPAWRRALRGCAVLLLATLCLAGCTTTESTLGPQENVPQVLAQWKGVQARRLPMEANHLVYVGITAHDFPKHAPLPAWGYSRQMLSQAFGSWLGVPDHRMVQLVSPTVDELETFFTVQLPRILGPDDTLVLYLGTHQLKNGNILLGHDTYVPGARFSAWLNALPQPTVFFADVCYGPAMEDRTQFRSSLVRVYASQTYEEATELLFNSRYAANRRYFAGTLAIIDRDLPPLRSRYSVMGLLLLHALRLELESPDGDGTLRLDRLVRRFAREQETFVMSSALTLHRPVIYNLQPWVLATANPNLPLSVGAVAPTKPLLIVPALDSDADIGMAAGDAPDNAIPDKTAAPDTAPAPAEPGAVDPRTALAAPLFAQLDAMLQQPDASRIDPAMANLIMGRILRPDLDIATYNARLDALADTLRPRVAAAATPEKKIAAINQLLFDDEKFNALVEPYDRDFLIDEVLDTRAGRCSALSGLYLAIGQRLGLPLRPVCLPEHVFVRWQLADADKGTATPAAAKVGWINIETTYKGVAMSERQYRASRPWVANPDADAFYLQSLDLRQTVAAFLSPLSSALRGQDRLPEAIRAAEMALKVLPNDAEGWNNLGMAQYRSGLTDAAAASYKRCLAINPTLAEAWNNLASTEPLAINRIPLYRKALLHKPGLADAWKNLCFAQYETGQYGLAWLSAKRCRELGLTLPEPFLQDLQRRRAQTP